MPYIDRPDRENIDELIDQLIAKIERHYTTNEIEGVMNYTLTRLISGVFGRQGWRYFKINRAIGVLESVKLEFYRRLAAPYENRAIAENGDISDYVNHF